MSENRKRPSERFIRWGVFRVLVATLPLVFNALVTLTQGASLSLSTLTGRGELLLVCTAMTATAIGDLVGSGKEKLSFKIISSGGCVGILMVAAWYFSYVSSSISADQPINQSFVADVSLVLFICSVVASGSCILLVEEDK